MEKNLQRQADGRKKAPELHIEPEPMSAILSQRMKCWMLGWLCEGMIFFFRRATERAAEELEVHGGMLPRSYPLFKFPLLDHHCRIHFNEARQLAVRARKHQPSVMGKPAPGAWQLAWQVEHGNFNPPSWATDHLPLWPMWKFVPHMVDAYRACSTYPQGPLRGQEPGETSGPGCQHLGRTPVSGSSACGSWTNFFGQEGLHHQLASIRDGAPAEAICD